MLGRRNHEEDKAMATVIWHGTLHERRELSNAVRHNCSCEFGLMGVRLSTCASHHMLNEDQRALNGLLFGRRIAGRLSDEEGLEVHQRASGVSRELLAGIHNDQGSGLGNALWGWASVARRHETEEFNASR
jgi:hypothetical protein